MGRRRNSRPSLMSLTKPLLKCPATNFSFFVSKKLSNCRWIISLSFNPGPCPFTTLSAGLFANIFNWYNSSSQIVSDNACAHPSKQNHLISRAGQPFKLAAKKPKKLCHHFLILANAKFQKISSVTVFTEVVAMISSFHRLSEKKNERKIMRTNYNCSNINRKNIYMRVQKNRKKDNTTKKISYAYTITISLRNYEVMNLGVETETKKILNGKKKNK